MTGLHSVQTLRSALAQTWMGGTEPSLHLVACHCTEYLRQLSYSGVQCLHGLRVQKQYGVKGRSWDTCVGRLPCMELAGLEVALAE